MKLLQLLLQATHNKVIQLLQLDSQKKSLTKASNSFTKAEEENTEGKFIKLKSCCIFKVGKLQAQKPLSNRDLQNFLGN